MGDKRSCKKIYSPWVAKGVGGEAGNFFSVLLNLFSGIRVAHLRCVARFLAGSNFRARLQSTCFFVW